MLGSMKGIKMTGLRSILFKSIHGLRLNELDISKGFRRLLIWNMALGKYTSAQSLAMLILNSVFVSNICSNNHLFSICNAGPQQRRRRCAEYGSSLYSIVYIRADD